MRSEIGTFKYGSLLQPTHNLLAPKRSSISSFFKRKQLTQYYLKHLIVFVERIRNGEKVLTALVLRGKIVMIDYFWIG